MLSVITLVNRGMNVRNTNQHTTVVPRNLDTGKLQTSSGDADYGYLLGLPAVIANGNSIVLGKPTVPFANRLHQYTLLSQQPDVLDDDPNKYNYLNQSWTEGDFLVDQVLYTQPGDTITAGQTIKVAEPVGLVQDGGTYIKTTMNECSELLGGSQYVVVLNKHPDNVHWLTNLELGRLNTDGTDSEDESRRLVHKQSRHREAETTRGVDGSAVQRSVSERAGGAYRVTWYRPAVPRYTAPSGMIPAVLRHRAPYNSRWKWMCRKCPGRRWKSKR